METFYPYRSYLLAGLIVSVALGELMVAWRQDQIALIINFGLIAALGLVLALTAPKLHIDGTTLTYRVAWMKRSVDLAKLTDCNYYFGGLGARHPMWVFHLYAADGSHTTIPAHGWTGRHRLYEALGQAVRQRQLTLSPRTARRLGLA